MSKTTDRGATEKMIAYVVGLADQRDYLGRLDGQVAETVFDVLGNQGNPNPKFIRFSEAGAAIDALKACPFKTPKIVGADLKTGGGFAAHDLDRLVQALAALPVSKFALLRKDGAYDFFEVVERKSGRRFLNQLVGAPGDWNRKRLIPHVQVIAAEHFAEDVDGALRAYVEQHGRCCRCDAKLSSGKSIADMVGPVCRKKLGW